MKTSDTAIMNILNNEYFKSTKYILAGLVLIIAGIINFVIAYMYFPELWIKNLSISTILIILGICIIIIFEEKIKRINRALKNAAN